MTSLVNETRLALGAPASELPQSAKSIAQSVKGVASEDAAAAVEALRDDGGDPDLAAACTFARRRRLGPYRRAGEGDRAKELGAFARAGFARAVAEALLACATPDQAEALARGEE